MSDKEKLRADARSLIEKKFGKGSIFNFTENPSIKVDTISTGSLGLDLILGVGGYPRGRIVEVFGPESAGKTTLALHALAEAQKAGGAAAFVDAEHALDPDYAADLGVDMDALSISQPDSGEQALNIVEILIRSGGYDVVVVDSVAALVPEAELQGEMGNASIGLQARLMGQALRKLSGAVSDTKTVLIFINQLRSKIGVMFGSNETTPGGRALAFYSSVRVDIRRVSSLKQGDVIIGGRTRVKAVKNKVGPPHKSAEFDILYGSGINFLGELLDYAVQLKIVEKSGAWYSYDGKQLGQGRDKSLDYLKENEETLSSIKAQLSQALSLKSALLE